jgi:type II secretory pathway pseudopilin PulG
MSNVEADPNPTEHGRDRDSGDTLIEVLVTISIIAIAFVALMGSLLSSTSASITNRGIANLDGILRSFAESARYQIQTQPEDGNTGPMFQPCAQSYPLISDPYPTSGPVGSTPVVVFATGFAPSSPLTVKVGGTPVIPVKGGTTDPLGDSTVLFTPTTTGSVSVTGTAAGGGIASSTAKVPFTSSPTNPGITASTYETYTLTSAVKPFGSSTCPTDQQQVDLSISDPQHGNAAYDSLDFVVGNFAPDPVVISTNALNPSDGTATSTVPANLMFTASVTSTTGSPESTGSVTWAITPPAGDPATCAGGSNTMGISNGTATCTLSLGVGEQGSYQVAATYSDGTNTYPSGTEAQSTATIDGYDPGLTVAMANSTGGLVFTATTTGATGYQNPDVNCAGGKCFNWTVTATTPTNQTTTFACPTVSGPTDSGSNSMGTCTVQPPTPGTTYTGSVSYSGSPDYESAFAQTSPSLTVPYITVTGAPDSPGSGTLDINVTMAGRPGQNPPSGTITCTPSGQSPIQATLSVNATNSTALCQFNPASGTAYTVAVAYSPDTNSNSTYTAQFELPPLLVPSIVITTSNSGDNLTFSATIAGPSGSPVPTGSISCTPSPTPTGTVTTSALTPNMAGTAAVATCSFVGAKKRSYTVTILYTPDANSSQYASWNATSAKLKAP